MHGATALVFTSIKKQTWIRYIPISQQNSDPKLQWSSVCGEHYVSFYIRLHKGPCVLCGKDLGCPQDLHMSALNLPVIKKRTFQHVRGNNDTYCIYSLTAVVIFKEKNKGLGYEFFIFNFLRSVVLKATPCPRVSYF